MMRVLHECAPDVSLLALGGEHAWAHDAYRFVYGSDDLARKAAMASRRHTDRLSEGCAFSVESGLYGPYVRYVK